MLHWYTKHSLAIARKIKFLHTSIIIIPSCLYLIFNCLFITANYCSSIHIWLCNSRIFQSNLLKSSCNSSLDLNSYTYLLPILLCNLSFRLPFMSAYTNLTSASFSVIWCAYLIVFVRCFANESFTFVYFPLIYFRFRYTFSLKACDLNLTTIADCFPSLVVPNRRHLSNCMSSSSSEKLRFLTITILAFLVISSVASCQLGVMSSSIAHALLWYCWRSSTYCDNSLFTFFVTISSLSSSGTLSSNF